MEIIRQLIERIEVKGGKARGQPEVTLVGGLASILDFALADNARKAAANGSGLCRVLMVAGAGFEPAAFRL
ncbi:MAG: hypothetical protein WCH83_11920 [Alphaproteobacteria bacterium]